MKFKQSELVDFEYFVATNDRCNCIVEEFIIAKLDEFMTSKVFEKMCAHNIQNFEYTFKVESSETLRFMCLFRKDGTASLDILLSPNMIRYQNTTVHGSEGKPSIRIQCAEYFDRLESRFEEYEKSKRSNKNE